MKPRLEISQLVKRFKDKSIYSNLSFTFQPGCYALVGQNGVGKTVLLEIIANILPFNSGVISLFNVGIHSSIEYKRQLVYIPEKADFFPFATGRQFLDFIASVNRVRPFDQHYNELISAFKLTKHLAMKFSDMSLGTQKKLFLSTLAIGEKSLFILDEPTNGLDIEACTVIADFLSQTAKEAIVILATHDQTLLKALNPNIIYFATTPITHFEGGQYANAIL